MVAPRNRGSYNAEEDAKLRGVPLPEKIKCYRCEKNFIASKFSERQLNHYRRQLLHTKDTRSRIACRTCTGEPPTELECVVCHKTKGLEEFAKSQKNNPDTARCHKCTEDLVKTQPIDHERYNQSDKVFLPADHSAGKYPEYFSNQTSADCTTKDEWDSYNGDAESSNGGALIHKVQGMSISSNSEDSLIPSDEGGGIQLKNGGRGSVHTGSWHTGPRSSNFGSSHRNKLSSVASQTGSAHTFTSSLAERSDDTERRPGGWAKIKAATGPVLPPGNGTASGMILPMGDVAREHAEDTNAWGSDDESEDDDIDSDDSDGENTVI